MDEGVHSPWGVSGQLTLTQAMASSPAPTVTVRRLNRNSRPPWVQTQQFPSCREPRKQQFRDQQNGFSLGTLVWRTPEHLRGEESLANAPVDALRESADELRGGPDRQARPPQWCRNGVRALPAGVSAPRARRRRRSVSRLPCGWPWRCRRGWWRRGHRGRLRIRRPSGRR